LNKYEIAKELTVTALNNKYITHGIDNSECNYVSMSEQLAENVAAFYNKLADTIQDQFSE